MKIKSCLPLKKRKAPEFYMVLRDASPHNVRESLLKPYTTTGKNIRYMEEEMLKILSYTLLDDTLMVMTELVRRDGLRTSHISTTKEIRNDAKKSIK